MKNKFICALLTTVMVLSFAACGSEGNGAAASTESTVASKGLAIGTSAHALGTAKAMELGEIEGAMSSLSIVVCGILTVISVSIFANFI